MSEDNVKNIIESEITELIKQFTQREERKFYQYYMGRVVDNNDPEKLGRCKVTVYGVFDDIPEKDLPWAVPEFAFIGSQNGSFIVPPNNVLVNVRFSDGNIYEPIYTTKCLLKTKLPADRLENYPNTLIFFETDNGDQFKINTLTREVEFKTSHGDKISVDTLGNITVHGILKITVEAPIVEVANTAGAVVTPNPTGGPFNCLPYDPITGAVHQGKIVVNS